MAKALNTQK
jgi:hypothetical protein